MATKAVAKPSPQTAKADALGLEMASQADLDTAEVAVVAQLRSKDLLDRVAAATDLGKNKVRSIVEATLTELGKALEAGEGVNLPQLGKIRIVNSRREDQGTIMTLKLRRSAAKPDKDAANEALAEAGEAS
jgi:nucleoid DNA-binding protein